MADGSWWSTPGDRAHGRFQLPPGADAELDLAAAEARGAGASALGPEGAQVPTTAVAKPSHPLLPLSAATRRAYGALHGDETGGAVEAISASVAAAAKEAGTTPAKPKAAPRPLSPANAYSGVSGPNSGHRAAVGEGE